MLAVWIGTGCEATRTGEAPTTGSDTAGTEVAQTSPSSIDATCSATDNPLRFLCTVTVSPAQSVVISFSRADGTGPERVHTSAGVQASHEVPLYFMEADSEYAWTATPAAQPAVRATGSFRTGTVPPPAVSSLEVTGTSSVPYVGTHHPCDSDATAVVYDTTTGQLVWYHNLEPAGTFGWFNMVQFTEDRTILGQTGAAVIEVTLGGYEVYRLTEGVDYTRNAHHDLFKRNGLYYLLYQDPGNPTLDGVYVFDDQRSLAADFRARTMLDVPPKAYGDWMHTNAVYVDPGGDLYLTSYSQNTVLRITGDVSSTSFGTQVWALAGTAGSGFGQDFAIDWGGLADSQFEEPHAGHLDSNGRLVLLDNVRGRALVFDLDEPNGQATLAGVYPSDQAPCGPQGTAAVSSAGHVFVACSGGPLIERSPDGAEVWRASAACGATVPLAARVYPLEGW